MDERITTERHLGAAPLGPPPEPEGASGRLVAVGGLRFRLEGDAALVRQSRRWIYPLEPETTQSGAQVVTLGRGPRRLFAEAPFGRIDAASAEDLFEQLDYDLTCQALAQESESTALHSACVRFPGGCLLLAGPHASGKTTLAVALSRHGGALLCDDVTLLRANPTRVRPLSRAIRLRPDSAALLPLCAEAAEPPSNALGIRRLEPARPDEGWLVPLTTIAVRYRAGAPAELNKVAPSAAVRPLLESTFYLRESPAQRLVQITALLSAAPFFSFEYGCAPLSGAEQLVSRLAGSGVFLGGGDDR